MATGFVLSVRSGPGFHEGELSGVVSVVLEAAVVAARMSTVLERRTPSLSGR
jgi:hypothetical protein